MKTGTSFKFEEEFRAPRQLRKILSRWSSQVFHISIVAKAQKINKERIVIKHKHTKIKVFFFS